MSTDNIGFVQPSINNNSVNLGYIDVPRSINTSTIDQPVSNVLSTEPIITGEVYENPLDIARKTLKSSNIDIDIDSSDITDNVDSIVKDSDLDESNYTKTAWFYLVVAVAAALATTIYVWTQETKDWYNSLKKSEWIPNLGIFPVMIFVMYLVNTYAVFRSFVKLNKEGVRNYLNIIFGIQTLLTILWGWVFFSVNNFGWSIGLLVGAIIMQIWLIYILFKIDSISLWLGVIFLIWLIFALTVVLSLNADN